LATSITHVPTATLVVLFCIVAIPDRPFEAIGKVRYVDPAVDATEVAALNETWKKQDFPTILRLPE